MKIVIDESSKLYQGSRGLITGNIYFEENNEYFPEKGWNDFPVIILGWWIHSFLTFVKQNSEKFEFCFMDGPFKLVGMVRQNELIEINSVHYYADISIKKNLGYTNKAEIQNMLLKACRKLFREVALSSISNNSIDVLKKLFLELKELQL